MSSVFDSIVARAMDRVDHIYGQTVIVTPQGGAPVVARAIFDPDAIHQAIQDGEPVPTQALTFSFLRPTVSLRHGTKITLGAQVYEVRDSLPADGSGYTRCLCVEVG